MVVQQKPILGGEKRVKALLLIPEFPARPSFVHCLLLPPPSLPFKAATMALPTPPKAGGVSAPALLGSSGAGGDPPLILVPWSWWQRVPRTEVCQQHEPGWQCRDMATAPLVWLWRHWLWLRGPWTPGGLHIHCPDPHQAQAPHQAPRSSGWRWNQFCYLQTSWFFKPHFFTSFES